MFNQALEPTVLGFSVCRSVASFAPSVFGLSFDIRVVVAQLRRQARTMGFVIWHYVARIGVWLLLPPSLCAILFSDGPLHAIGNVAVVLIVILGTTGAILAIRVLFAHFRFACPRCSKRSTQFGGSKAIGMWLYCEDCCLTVRESGFLKMGLQYNDDEKEA